ncbi:MAG: hypothetical protein HYY52_03735 [Candidatus Melainabacteria bacterium]|nr:hypothetical protein [Candidatus Melainabacteria bacterium]
MSKKSRIERARLQQQAKLAVKPLVNKPLPTTPSAVKSGEKPGGDVQAATVGKTVCAQASTSNLRYQPHEYESRLSQARKEGDYAEGVQLIEEAIRAKLTFLTDENTKRDIESIVRGLRENGEVLAAVLLATYCFKNKINYETRPKPITTESTIVAGQKECPFETAGLMLSAIENGLHFEEPMITTTAVQASDSKKPGNNIAYGQLVLTAVKHGELKDPQFIEITIARLANPKSREGKPIPSDLSIRGELAYKIAVEYLDRKLQIKDKARIDKTIHDLRRIPDQVPNAVRLLSKALRNPNLEIDIKSVHSTIAAVRDYRDLDRDLAIVIHKLCITAFERFDSRNIKPNTIGELDWEVFDILCSQYLMKYGAEEFAIQIAVKAAEYGFILRAGTLGYIYDATNGLPILQTRTDLRGKREQLLDLIKHARTVHGGNFEREEEETTNQSPVRSQRTDLRGGLDR